MERPSKEEGKETKEKLQQQYKHLQEEWESIKESSKPRTLHRSSTDSRTMVKGLRLLDNSPRNPTSLLQHRRAPSDSGGGAWKVRINDLAVEEVLIERKEAIESGKLKGRRLFERARSASKPGSGERQEMICSDWDGLVQESEVRSVLSYDDDDYNDEKQIVESKEKLHSVDDHLCGSCSSAPSSSSSYICDECREKETVAEDGQIKVVAASAEEEKRGVSGAVVFEGWLAIGLIVCAIGMWIFHGYEDGNEVILVPT